MRKRRWLCGQDWSCDGAGVACWLLVRCPVWTLSCSASYSLPRGKVTHFVLTFLENFVSSPFCLTLFPFQTTRQSGRHAERPCIVGAERCVLSRRHSLCFQVCMILSSFLNARKMKIVFYELP